MHELTYVFLDLHRPLLLFLVGRITLPSFLLLHLVRLVLTGISICALNAVTKLSAFYSTFVAEAVLFLAMRFFASAKGQLLHPWVIAVYLLEIVYVFTVLLLH
jgi:hypothetical protein